MAIELAEIDFENIGVWPSHIKMIICVVVFLIMLSAGYWFDIRIQLNKLHKAEKEQVVLEAEIEKQQAQVLPIKILEFQIEDIKSYLGNAFGKIQSSMEIPKILEDISLQGTKSGLEFRSVQPLAEVKHDFYADTPINIVVVGDYHQLGRFVADLSALPRYVVITDFSLKKDAAGNTASSQAIKNADNTVKDKLEMSIQAHIYRSTSLAK